MRRNVKQAKASIIHKLLAFIPAKEALYFKTNPTKFGFYIH